MIKISLNNRIISLGEDIRISGIDNGESWASVIFTTGGTEGDVVSSVENDFSLGNGSIVFKFSLSDGWAVVTEDN